MAVLKCKICGGDIDVASDLTLGTCQYCGTTMTIPKIDSDKKARLYNRAIKYLNNCEFDKAYSAYESITSEDELEAEAYWGMILSEYGIEYVEDPVEKKRIPTCHRTRSVSPRKTINYDLAIKYASDDQKTLYIKEAEEIERLQNNIKTISSKEKPYDVFICYKYSDDTGNPTEDSAIAHEIFDSLEQSGLRVFFSKITLEDKLGTEYEPYIYAALKSAKILLLITTNKEYCNSIWVKNEWSRFLEFMKDDKEKNIVPIYKNISPNDLPDELKKFQGLDISKLGALHDLKHIVRKQIEWSRQNGLINIYKVSIKKSYCKWAAIVGAGIILVIAVIVIVVSINKKPQNQLYVVEDNERAVSNEKPAVDFDITDKEDITKEVEEESAPESHEKEFLEFAKQQKYLNGRSGIIRTSLSNDYIFDRDLSEVPFGNIDCFISDFDGDGEDELLIPSIEKQQWLTFSMFEYTDKVELSDQYEYQVNTLASDKGMTVSFTYDFDNDTYIGIFTDDYYYITGDGLFLNFAGIVYNGQEFIIKGFTDYAGSDDSEDRNFMKTLQNCGIRIGWNSLLSENAWKEVLSLADGRKLFDILTKINEPHNWGNYSSLYGYVTYTGYSPVDFTYYDGTEPISQSSWEGLDSNDDNDESEYIIPDSSDRYLTEIDLQGLSNEDLRKARNEIAAKHGRRFKDEDLQTYFDSKSWYNGTIDPDDFNKIVRLSDIEQKNMEFIKKHEK